MRLVWSQNLKKSKIWIRNHLLDQGYSWERWAKTTRNIVRHEKFSLLKKTRWKYFMANPSYSLKAYYWIQVKSFSFVAFVGSISWCYLLDSSDYWINSRSCMGISCIERCCRNFSVSYYTDYYSYEFKE